MNAERRIVVGLVAALVAVAAGCANVPGPLGSGGLDTERLERLANLVRADVERGRIPGVVMMVARDGDVAMRVALGKQDPAKGTPMSADSIFRIYSMTKPIVSVAAMILVEEGRLHLSDQVAKHVPQLKGLKVGIEKGGKLELVAAQRAITVQDLLRHTAGFTYNEFGKSLVKEEYKKAGVGSDDITNGELVNRLAKVPLQMQPGSAWEYGRSTDVLGHVIEKVSGQPLDRFLQERIFDPLEMRDTAFFVEPAKQGRIAEAFAKDPDGGSTLAVLEVRKSPKLLAGGHGLVSTAADYLRFAQMLLNGGELKGVRILSRKSVEYMSSDHLGAIRGPGPGYGFGLGFAVRQANGLASTPGSAGDYNWGGYGGTYFWVDPKERLVAVWMMQAPNQRTYYRELYRNLVYSALR